MVFNYFLIFLFWEKRTASPLPKNNSRHTIAKREMGRLTNRPERHPWSGIPDEYRRKAAKLSTSAQKAGEVSEVAG
jgi:hypothetical protein